MATATVNGTSVTFSNSGAAADLTNTRSEDASLTFTFDVLSASGGGKNTTVYSLDDGIKNDDGGAAITVTNKAFADYNKDLLIQDLVNVDMLTTKGAKVYIGSDGLIRYDATGINTAIQALKVGETLTDTFQYTIKMANGTLSVGTLTTTFTGANDVATIKGDETATLTEDTTTAVTGTLTVSDADAGESKAQTATNAVSIGGLGTYSVDADGKWSYKVDNAAVQHLKAGANTTDTFTVKSLDGTASKTVTVTITGVNDAPVANIDTASTTENATKTIDVLANDTDVDDDAVLTLTTVSAPAGKGTASIAANKLVFNPGADFDHLKAGATESVTLTYTVKDDQGATANSTVTLTVTGENDAPVANADTASTTENAAVLINVLANDTDIDDGAVLTLASVSAPSGKGSASLLGNKLSFNPGTDFDHLKAGATENVTLNYTITDDQGATSNSTVTLTITGENDIATITGANTGNIVEDTTLTASGALTVSDVDDGENKAQVVTNAASIGGLGTYSVDADGKWTYDVTNASIQSLGKGVTTTDTFSVVSKDGTDTETVTVTITGVNDAATIAGDKTGSVTEDSAVAATGALTVSDVDTGENKAVAASGASTKALGTYSVTEAGGWTYSLDSTKLAVQSLGAGKSTTDTFNVVSKDGTATETVTVTINGVNDAASITGDKAGSITEDGVMTVGGTLTVSDVDTDEAYTKTAANADSDSKLGKYSVDADGKWSYTADNALLQHLAANATATDTFTVTSVDGTASQLVTVTITGVNDDATISGAKSGNVVEDTTLSATGVLTVSDVDDGENKAQVVTNAASIGGLGTYSVDADGKWTYDVTNASIQHLGKDVTTTDTFKVLSKDGTASETVTVTITGVNDAATITGKTTGSVVEDGISLATGVLTVSDVDTGEDKAQDASGKSALGAYSVDADGKWAYTVDQTKIQYLGAGKSTTDTFSVTSKDGGTSETVTVTINGVNDAASIAGDTTGKVTEDNATPATGVLTVSDVDTGEDKAQIATNAASIGGLGAYSVTDAGAWTYTLDSTKAAVQALGAGKTTTDTFNVVSKDGTDTETVTVTITGVNDAATITGKTTGDIVEDTTLTTSGVLTVSDVDTGEDKAQAAAGGTKLGFYAVDAAGQWTYDVDNAKIQALGAGKSTTDTFSVVSKDGTATEAVTITITGVNDVASIAGDTTGKVTEDNATPATGTLTVSDVDTGENKAVAASGVSAKGLGTYAVTEAGAWTYTLDSSKAAVQALGAGKTTTDTFTVTSADGTDTETVTATITGVNDAPTATADSYSTKEDQSVTGAILGNDEDVDGDVLSAVLVNGPTNGALTLNPDGTFKYTPNANYNGPDSFTYKASDGTATSAIQTVSLTISPVNDAPVAKADSYTLAEDGVLTIAANGVLGNDTDIDSASLTAAVVTGPAHGTLALNADGSFKYTPNANYNGPDSFTYKANDGSDDSSAATVSLTVTPVNDAAVIGGKDTGVVTEATSKNAGTPQATGTLTVSDVDGPGQEAFATLNNVATTYGKFTLGANGAWTYNLDNTNKTVDALKTGDTLHDKVTVTSLDGTSHIVDVTINGVTDATLVTKVFDKTFTLDTKVSLTQSGSVTLPTDVGAFDLSIITATTKATGLGDYDAANEGFTLTGDLAASFFATGTKGNEALDDSVSPTTTVNANALTDGDIDYGLAWGVDTKSGSTVTLHIEYSYWI